jgi:hypothetical protein
MDRGLPQHAPSLTHNGGDVETTLNPPRSPPARPAPSFARLVLVEPGVYTRVFDLDYQAEQFELFHGHASTRWTHYLGTQVIVASLLLLTWELRVGPVALAVVVTAGLGGWYVAMHRAVGVVAALQVVVLATLVAGLRDAFALTPAHAVIALGLCALAQNLSHAREPVPPALTGRGFEPFPLYWSKATTWERVRLLLLNTLYLPLELVSAPRLFAVHVLRALHRLGWRRPWADDVRARAQAMLGR